MFFWMLPKAPLIAVIETTQPMLKLLIYRHDRGEFWIENGCILPIPADVMQLQSSQAREQWICKLGNILASYGKTIQSALLAVPANQVDEHSFTAPLAFDEYQCELLVAEKLLRSSGYPIAELLYDYWVTKSQASPAAAKLIRCFVVRKAALAWQLELLKRLGLKCCLLDIEEHALARAVQWLMTHEDRCGQTSPIVLFSIYPNTARFQLITNGAIQFCYENAIDTSMTTNRVTSRQQACQSIRQFWQTAWRKCQICHGDVKICQVMISADSGFFLVSEVEKFLTQVYALKVVFANPFQTMHLSKRAPSSLITAAGRMLVCCGLMLNNKQIKVNKII